jgi:hypothetical protein
MAARFAPQAVEPSEAERDAEREARFLAAFRTRPEITGFEEPEQISRDVAEQLI